MARLSKIIPKYKTYCTDNLEVYAVTFLERRVEGSHKKKTSSKHHLGIVTTVAYTSSY